MFEDEDDDERKHALILIINRIMCALLEMMDIIFGSKNKIDPEDKP